MGGLVRAHRQAGYSLRFDWGTNGAEAVGAKCDVVAVVDVLSFTTTLSLAVDRGLEVLPYPKLDQQALAFAAAHNATLAVGRGEAGPGQASLSPGSIAGAAIPTRRLVLPSPNGSTISFRLAALGPAVIGLSLRTRAVVAEWLLARRRQRPELSVAVIASGERWPDGSLRPAVEDLWGAGALAELLRARGWPGLSPEARVAADSFRAVRNNLDAALADCGSGRELADIGYAGDVHLAARLDSANAVPLLHGDTYLRTLADTP